MQVLNDPSGAAAQLLAQTAGAHGHIALTGGSTPGRAYEIAAQAGADWSHATLWFGDDRCVAPDDERSNYRMAKATLLDRLADPGPTVHRIEGERGPQAGADDYEAKLRDAFGAGMPSLDLVLLGLGSDGHIASLFPGKPALEEHDRLVVGVPEAGLEPFVPRVSFTLGLINAARSVVFLIAGEGKADAVAGAFSDDPDPALPASRVAPASGELTVLLDPPAASRLEAS